MLDISQSQEIYTITRLNREVRFLLEGNLPLIWVEGEISNFAAPHSGHWYFSLKDESAQVRCAMFKPQNRRLNFLPKEGMHVLAKVRVSLYEGRGEFQLLAEILEEAGPGKLQREFEALKKRLADKGLFDAAYKKTLPLYPKCIGIITSTTGAAIRDILNVLKRRYCCADIVIYPTLVQGNMAAAQIVQAIQTAGRQKICDVLILARGGGSIEDLWPFNEEIVAHAIFACEVPLVSGIGHEIDFTIADFVADLRASTPSAAAELVVPDKMELLAVLAKITKTLQRLIKDKLKNIQDHLMWTRKHLYQLHPKHQLHEKNQQLDLYEAKLMHLQLHLLSLLQNQLKNQRMRLLGTAPGRQVEQLQHYLASRQTVLQNQMQTALQMHQRRFVHLGAKLDTLSPLATLQRGFAIVNHKKTGKILSSIHQVCPGDKIGLRVLDGSILCTVD